MTIKAKFTSLEGIGAYAQKAYMNNGDNADQTVSVLAAVSPSLYALKQNIRHEIQRPETQAEDRARLRQYLERIAD